MSKTVKDVNNYFREATKADIEELLSKIYVTEHQKTVMLMFYIDKYDIDFISYKTKYSRSKINQDLKIIRRKIIKAIGTKT